MSKDYDKKILTIPNVLTLVRLILIPFFVWQYLIGNYVAATIIVVASGFTDVIDGFIARKFNMVSALGKALDPVADKLTQISVMLCLVRSFPKIWFPLALLIIKEFVSGILGLMIVTRTGTTYSAEWHGKAATVSIYAMTVLHIIWVDIPAWVSLVSIIVTVSLMALSFVLYAIRNVRTLRGLKREDELSDPSDSVNNQ